MNSYNKMPTRTRKNCQQCGEVFRGFEDEGICLRCKSYQEHPEEAPGYWKWIGPEQGRRARSTWTDKMPMPWPGETITVHRKDGSGSTQTIAQVEGLMYRPTGEPLLDVYVKP